MDGTSLVINGMSTGILRHLRVESSYQNDHRVCALWWRPHRLPNRGGLRRVQPTNRKENNITSQFHISYFQGFQIQSRGWKRQVLD